MSTPETASDSHKYSQDVRNLHVLNRAVVDSTSATALVVGANGEENPAFSVDASTASSATGWKAKSAAAAAGATMSVTSSATNEKGLIDAKGTGALALQRTGTGAVTIHEATATAAGGAVALTMGSAAVGIYWGSGAPSSLSAAQGSLYLNTTGSSTSTRLYVNSTGSTTWVAVTTAS